MVLSNFMRKTIEVLDFLDNPKLAKSCCSSAGFLCVPEDNELARPRTLRSGYELPAFRFEVETLLHKVRCQHNPFRTGKHDAQRSYHDSQVEFKATRHSSIGR